MNLTVIIPIYNAEKHLEKCINSVMNQACGDFELLLINDGSTDQSGKICERFAAKDQRIKIFRQRNSGVSAARNLGIENAVGKWITFIDADDYISANYFKVLESETDVDIILQGLTYVEDSNVIKHIAYQAEKLVLKEFMLKYTVYPYFSSSWSKFFKLEILKQQKISFNERLTFGEDTLFNLNYLRFCKLIMTSDFSGYFYRVLNSGLANSAYSYQHDLSLYRAFEDLRSKYRNRAFFEESIKIPLSRLAKAIYFDKTIQIAERRKILKEIVEGHYDIVLRIYTDPKIKVFFVTAYYTGFYLVLDFVLYNLARKSR